MRLLAASPFIIMGVFAVLAALWGVFQVAQRPPNDPRDKGTFAGVLFMMLIAMITLPLGALLAGAFQ